jgi:hypothetical protein
MTFLAPGTTNDLPPKSPSGEEIEQTSKKLAWEESEMPPG